MKKNVHLKLLNKTMEPSSTSSFPKTYDVFISSRGGSSGGDDSKFASELAKELSNIGLRTYEGFKLGGDSQIMQEEAIKNSRHFIVVLTKDYVTSIRCLRELSRIMESRGEDYEEVITVFYKDHPSCLVKELEDFGKRLEDHKKEVKQKLLMELPRCTLLWKDSANLPKTIFVEEKRYHQQVNEIINKVKESSTIVGISPQLHQVDDLLDLDSNDVRFIGIVGMGGIVSVQKKLLLRLGGKLDKVIKNEDHGAKLIKKCLRNKKFLIVLDGVDERRQIKKLARSPDWFNPGSRIIVTTRNRNLCYNVEFLDHDAFGEDHEPPDENFRDLAEEMTSYNGLDDDSQQIFLDLACFFNNGMSVDRVIEILESFGYKSSHKKLHLLAERNLIQISYDMVQMHTLVRCMGRGNVRRKRETQTRIWLRKDLRRVYHEESGLKHVHGIVVVDMEDEELELEAKPFAYMTELKLLEMNNVKVDGNIELQLSNKLRFLNWNGYPFKHLPSNFEPQSLLELHLRNSNLMRLWEGKKEFIWLKEIDVSGSENLDETPDFSNVPNLQRLILRNCGRLCVVHPSITTLNHLVLVDMANCLNLKIFPSKLITCKRLQTLILSNSGLECFPEIEKPTKSLTELHLDGTLIQDLPLSFGLLTHLTLLNLRDCTQLCSLPRSIRKLISLQTLNLNGCKKLHQIPFTLGAIQSLTMLDIGGTSVDQAPYAITSLMNLETLNCERLSSRNIWHSFSALCGNDVLPLKDLNLSDCNLEDEDIPDDIKCLSLLEILDLSKNSFVKLKESLTQLVNLKALYLNDCINIQPQLLPKLPTTLQYVGGQNSQDNISQNVEVVMEANQHLNHQVLQRWSPKLKKFMRLKKKRIGDAHLLFSSLL
ncbi:TMV resistance protein N-like [Benincasa hispida]|uniref:TMV resistance protein N-like n=1 Tax=Benincasa hispida TaxID=102211 RepID=UPI00190048EC|nr:TMV resistance protein N-like [Benincasa hispida]